MNIKRLFLKISAYGVHVLTALGAALGLWSLILIYDGLYQNALWVLALAVLVDSVDGVLARKVKINTHAPLINGSLLDNIVDFLTWTAAPLIWIYATMNIPAWVLVICATASVLGFSNKEAKTEDHFFKGFPSYWNIVVFYLFLLDMPETYSSGIMLIFALLTLVPVKFIYPTRTDYLKHFTLLLGILFFFQLIMLLYLYDESPILLVYSSFLFPVYYFGLSFYLNIQKI